ncbi:SusD/RagB family nutrient-binding outer membrane lipoprotein [Pontibacter sp. 13R65]|uniref:SusD/RagB family nutrient-binding outer membrane lipoprotein n=1 Tax=Pontibacter sp. 13R65 TaxID=3127458 RepID=UPI00301E02C0
MKTLKLMLIATLLLVIGCTKDLEEINKNPNAPESIEDPGFLLAHIIRSSANANLRNSFSRGSVAADQLASAYASNFSNWTRSEAESYYNWSFYSYIRDLNEIIALSEEKGYNNYKGIALVLRSWLFQNLTDLYGPIPFREAASVKYSNITTPVYESQEAVYAGLLADLETAVSLLGTSSESVNGDILYSGDIQNWKKFSSGLMLRLLMRQSNRVNPTAQMERIISDPVRYPLFTSHSDQAALQYLADTRANEAPFYRNSNSDYGISYRASNTLVNYLQSLNDPRLYVFALPASLADVGYAGAINGTGDWDNPAKYSPPGMLWAPLQYNPLASPVAAQSILLSYSEVQFILAEAAEKGFLQGGSSRAAEHYLNGIKMQFTYYSSRIPANYDFPKAADVDADAAYYEQAAVSYTGTKQQKIEKIWLQKWLSLYLVGFEAWSEWKRTGFPHIVAGPVSPGHIPQRVLYPADEMRLNEQNYKNAVQLLGSDELSTKVWWAK